MSPMLVLPGYHVTEELSIGSTSTVYRARRQVDGQPVVLKRLSNPTPERLAWFRREYELTAALGPYGAAAAYALEHHQSHWLLVLEDFGGESLTRLGLAGSLDLPSFLRLALAVTATLGQVHQQQVVHKDLSPAHIVVNPRTGQVKLVDFGIATRLPRETTPFRVPSLIEGTLAYLSPEQTGRMNRPVDYRSDFYTLGVTFYELLTGRLPFVSDDPLDLVYSHIAGAPPPPHTLRADIPEPLSAIILKLLAKEAADRYQSAAGLQADLQVCLDQLERSGAIAPFPIGQHDARDRFMLPRRLYGRKAELAALLDTFDHLARAGSALLLVAGPPGVGKTALVQEVYQPLTRRRGLFIASTFDRLRRDSPYVALAQAFRGLIRQLLTERAADVAGWCERLGAALGASGQVIIDVIPELQWIIGPQPAVPPLPPAQAQDRFNLLFQRFVQAFAHPDQPLVLFLDDLQWADSASLKLLELLMTAPDTRGMYIIGAYRDTELAAGHPLHQTLETLAAAALPVRTVVLPPLDAADVARLAADTLACDPADVAALADLLVARTGGNPFFLRELLQALWHAGLIWFDRPCWRWDLQAIEAWPQVAALPPLVAERLRRLPDDTRQILQTAASIGGRFDLAMLAAVSALPPAETARRLEPALAAGLVEPLDSAYQVAPLLESVAAALRIEYRFGHDHIQQAAAELAGEGRGTETIVPPALPPPDAGPAHRPADGEALRAALDLATASQPQPEHWARRGPSNSRHRYELIEAERCRVLGQYGQAREHYDMAIALAQEDGYAGDEALACELAGRFYLARGQQRLALIYLRDAHDAYTRAGAVARARQIEAQHAALLQQAAPFPARSAPATNPPATGGANSAGALGVAGLFKTAQTITGEIVLGALIKKLLHVAIEQTGAMRGVLILPQRESWIVAAEQYVGRAAPTLFQAGKLLANAALPHSLISHLLRTWETVVLDDAPHTGNFTQDPYLRIRKPRSVLGLPLLHQGRLAGLIYLEHPLTSAAFTPDRIEVLQLLSGQMAVALENARLYSQKEALVAERTAALQAEIAERSYAEAALRESEATLRAVIDNPLVGFLIYTYQGNILFANPGVTAMSGYSNEALLSMQVWDLLHPDERQLAGRRVTARIADEDVPAPYEYRTVTRDGEIRWIEIAVTKVDYDGQLAFVASVVDITARKQIEAGLA